MKSIGREILWNLPQGTGTLLYGLAGAAAAIFSGGVLARLRAYRRGRPEEESRLADPFERIGTAIRVALGRTTAPDKRAGGLIHFALFASFAALSVVTGLVAVEHDLGLRILDGGFYVAFKLFAETAGLLLLAGVAAALARRYVVRPDELPSRAPDLLPLLALAGIALTGFLIETVRIAATHPDAAPYSYASRAAASFFAGFSAPELLRLHRTLWWAHLGLALGFLASVPYGKMRHALAGPANVFLRTARPPGVLAPLADFEARETVGAGSIGEFSWKHLLDLDACARCGRCEALCPAHRTGKDLSPRKLIDDLRRTFDRTGTASGGGRGDASGAPVIGDGAVRPSELWACTTCGQCRTACPVAVEHVEKIVDMRRHLVLGAAKIPPGLETMFRRLETYSDPWGMGPARRMEWAAGLGVREVGAAERVDLLLWVGCAGAFDERYRAVLTALVRILAASGTDFGVLGARESCCGDFARRGGDEELFRRLREKNREALAGCGAGTVVTPCPHCFNALRNESPGLGGLTILHHSVWIRDAVDRGALRFSRPLEKVAAYHDPCYLGRYNGIYDPPRSVLAAVPGLSLAEAELRRGAAFCCGGGGGHLWLEEDGERIGAVRAAQLRASKADVVATACPHCLSLLEDGIGATGTDGSVPEVLDVAEIVARAM